eukprot:467428-Pelagomonas_calceolata.AAC.5
MHRSKTVLNLAAAVCVGPGLSIYNFELERELFTFPFPGMPCITDRVVPHNFIKPLGQPNYLAEVPGMLRESNFLAMPGLGIVIVRTLPTSVEEEETHWLKGPESPLLEACGHGTPDL